MAINNTTPVIVPAVSASPELEYDQLWLSNIVISAQDQTVANHKQVDYSKISSIIYIDESSCYRWSWYAWMPYSR